MDYISRNITRPKLTVTKAINKFLISWDIKLARRTKIFYAWEKDVQPEWLNDSGKPTEPYIGVDYDQYKKIWYLSYIINDNNIYYGTIDDTTGSIDISKI